MSATSSGDGAAVADPPTILVVEDEMLLMMTFEDMLIDFGCCVLKAGRVAKAAQLAATAAIDGAILDVNVAGETVYPVADELRRRRIPFLFATGYGAGGLRADYRDWPTLGKPFRQRDLQALVATWTVAASAVTRRN